MIGKTIYKAKVVDNKVKMLSWKIIEEKRNKYKFSDGVRGCLKSDIGVVFFLTKQEAIDYLIKELKRSVKMGKQYLKKTQGQLEDAIVFLKP